MRFKFTIYLTLALILTSCGFPGANTPEPTADIAPTLAAAKTQAVLTFEAEQAALPSATSLPPTATLAPSATAIPTNTPVPSNTAVIFTNTPPSTNTPAGPTSTPTLTITPTPSEYGCAIISFSPTRGDTFPPNSDFDGRWTVKNIGKNTWKMSDTDYRYSSGEKMHVGAEVFDFSKDITPGESIDLIIDMLAPSTAGTYTTTWSINLSKTSICALPITVVVK
jgi:hypothetical protein